MIVLAVVLFVLAFVAVTAGSPPWDRRLLVLLLFVAVLACWIAAINDEPSRSGLRVRTDTVGAALAAQTTIPPTSTTTSTTTTTVPPPARARPTSLAPGDLGVFKVTCYGPPLFPAGQTTASGDPVGPGSIAVDPSVIPMGTRLEVEGYGEGVANDRGSKVRGRHVDVWRADPYHDCPIRSARVRVVSS